MIDAAAARIKSRLTAAVRDVTQSRWTIEGKEQIANLIQQVLETAMDERHEVLINEYEYVQYRRRNNSGSVPPRDDESSPQRPTQSR